MLPTALLGAIAGSLAGGAAGIGARRLYDGRRSAMTRTQRELSREGSLALAMLRESPDYVEDARAGSRVGNSVVGSLISLQHGVPRQYAESGVREALAVLDAGVGADADGGDECEDVTLQPTGSAPLRFRGRLLVDDSTHRMDANRWHDIAIYRVEDGRYAISATYRSKWQGEEDQCHIEDVGEASAIEGALADLCEDLLLPDGYGYPAHPQLGADNPMAAKQARLVAELRRRWNAMVSRVLREIPGTARPL